MITLNTLPHGWEKIGKDEMNSTIATFQGGYRSKSEDVEIRVWAPASSPFFIKDGELYFPQEIDEDEADYVSYEGTSTEVLDMFNKPRYYVARFYRSNVVMMDTSPASHDKHIKRKLAEDMDEVSDIVEQWLDEKGAFEK